MFFARLAEQTAHAILSSEHVAKRRRRSRHARLALVIRRLRVEGLEDRRLLSTTPTFTAISASAATAVVGQNVTFTAQVTPAPPDGETVAFIDGPATLGAAPLANGVANLTAPLASPGFHSVRATYSGDDNFAASNTVAGPTSTITTFAGGGVGDGGPATEAALRGTGQMAMDPAGNLFIAEVYGGRVRRVDAITGNITTVAGDGSNYMDAPAPRDGDLATAVGLVAVTGVAVDANGHLFVAQDAGGVFEVDLATGIITNVCKVGYSPTLAVDAAGQDLFIDVAYADGGGISKVDLSTGETTMLASGFVQNSYYPSRSWIAVDPSGQHVFFTAAAGRGQGLFSVNPSTGAVDDLSFEFFLNTAEAAAWGIDGLWTNSDATGAWTVHILAYNSSYGQHTGYHAEYDPSGSWNYSMLPNPWSLDLQDWVTDAVGDASGNLFIADACAVYKVDQSTQDVSVYAGGRWSYLGDGGPATAAGFSHLNGVTVDAAGNVFIADGDRIRKVEATNGLITTVAGTGLWDHQGYYGDGGPATAAELNRPYGVAVDAEGNIYIADSGNQRVRKVEHSTGIITTLAGNGIEGYSGDGGQANGASLALPMDVAVNSAGDLFIADMGNHTVRMVDHATGVITTVAGNAIEGYSGDGGPATDAELGQPTGIELDATGTRLFVADWSDFVIREVNLSASPIGLPGGGNELAPGAIATIAGDGTEGYSGDGEPATEAQLGFAYLGSHITLDDLGQRLLIADAENSVIRQVDLASGIITTIAGGGSGGLGDGGPAAEAGFQYPASVAVGPGGTVYVADYYDYRVRKIAASQTVLVGRTMWVGGDLLIGNMDDNAEITLDAGTEPGTLSVLYNGATIADNITVTGAVKITGGQNDNVVVKASLPGGLVVDAQGGSDTYVVELGNLAGPVDINDTGPGEDSLTVIGVQNADNSFDKTTGTVTRETTGTAETVNFSGIDHLTLVGGSMGNVFVDPDTGPTALKDTTIVAGPPGSVNTVQIANTAAEVMINDGGGQNNIAITLGSLAAPVTVQGTTGDNHVTINAPSESSDLTLTASQLTSGAETINLDLISSPSSLDINLGEGAPTVEIVSTSLAGVTINAQGGSDSSYNFVVDMGRLAGPVAINADAGTSQVAISAPSGENELTLAGTQLSMGAEVVNLNLGSTLTGLAVDGSAGTNQLVVEGSPPAPLALGNVAVLTHVQFGGTVFADRDNDGIFDPADGDAGIPGVSIRLLDQGGSPVATATSGTDGSYLLDLNLSPRTYTIVEEQPDGLLDGQDVPGALGGTVDNTGDSDAITNIEVHAGDRDAPGYNFAELQPSRIQGLVWEDFNDDGEVDFGEKAIAGASIRLMGTDDRGQLVDRVMDTKVEGIFEFVGLRPSGAAGYTLNEVQPLGFVDGEESLGRVNGVPTGLAANDVFSAIQMPLPGSDGLNYNFGERPQAGAAVATGQTATIGFCQNRNGQKLITSLNGGTGTQLGDWLAATFSTLYGVNAGNNNLAGRTNAQVAAFYQSLFKRNGKDAEGPPKLDAQVLAVAFAVYVTNENLAATTAAAYGFRVTASGAGIATFDVRDARREAFGLTATDSTVMTVLDILLATDAQTRNGRLYDTNNNRITDGIEASLRSMANDIYSAINEAGHL